MKHFSESTLKLLRKYIRGLFHKNKFSCLKYIWNSIASNYQERRPIVSRVNVIDLSNHMKVSLTYIAMQWCFLIISMHVDELKILNNSINYNFTEILLMRSLNVVLSCVMRLSMIDFQYWRQWRSIWKKPLSSRSSRASFLHALRVYW